jgi:hypothetical protein
MVTPLRPPTVSVESGTGRTVQAQHAAAVHGSGEATEPDVLVQRGERAVLPPQELPERNRPMPDVPPEDLATGVPEAPLIALAVAVLSRARLIGAAA